MSENGIPPRRMTKQAVQRGLGLGIVRLRRRKGWSQAELARRLKVSRHRLGKWELGEHAPPLEDLVALLEALETTFEDLALDRVGPAVPLPPTQRTELTTCLNGLLRIVKPWVMDPNGTARPGGARSEPRNEQPSGAMQAPDFKRR